MAGMILLVAACSYIALTVGFGALLKKQPGVNAFKSADNSWLEAIYLAYISKPGKDFKVQDSSPTIGHRD